MKRVYFLSYLIFTLSISSFAQSKEEEQIIELSKRKFQWLVSKNIDSLKMVLDDTAEYVHSNGWIQTKQEVLDDVVSGKLNYTEVSIAEAHVRLYSGTAILIGKGKFSGITGKNTFSMELLYTEVYVKRGSRWLLASRHANRL